MISLHESYMAELGFILVTLDLQLDTLLTVLLYDRSDLFVFTSFISSPEPKAHGELLWSLTVRRRRRRRCRRRRRRPDVRLSTIFKQHLLLNH